MTDKLKKYVPALPPLLLGIAMLIAKFGYSDTGFEGATRKEEGSYGAMRTISISSNTGTAMFPASIKRPDGICRIIGPYTFYVGTVTATAAASVPHDNVLYGFPVFSTETFRLDGSFTGVWAASLSSGTAGPQSIVCLDGLVQ